MSIPATNFSEIEQYIEGKDISAAYPKNLPLDMLKQIIRDLRMFEQNHGDYSAMSKHAAPFVIFLRLLSESKLNKGTPSEFQVPEETVSLLYAKFIYYVERELVGRVLGIPIDKTEEMLREFKIKL